MSLTSAEAKMFGFAPYLPVIHPESRVQRAHEIYEQNRHRVYSLAFLMTDSELVAEELTIQTFSCAFARNTEPSDDDVDQALISELRTYFFDLGRLTLDCSPCKQVHSVRRNTLRVDLERAVVQLPNTEKMMFLMHDVEGYGHDRIARLLDVTEDDSRQGVHQARLRVRELLAK
jgi:RNA polymerase sigma-70 factor, ECF subfamily